MVSDERVVWRLNLSVGASLIASPAYQGWPTWSHHLSGEVTEVLQPILPIRSLRISRGLSIPNASNHSLYLTKLSDSSYPEGNFGENQLLDGSISLSPLYASLTNDLHVSTATSLHQSFP